MCSWPREKCARGGHQTHIPVMNSEAIKQLQQYARHPCHSYVFQRRRCRFRKILRSRRRRCVPNGSQRSTRRAAGKRSGRRRGFHTLFELRQYIILGVRRRLLRGAPPALAPLQAARAREGEQRWRRGLWRSLQGEGRAEQAKAAGTSPGTSKFVGKVADLSTLSFARFCANGIDHVCGTVNPTRVLLLIDPRFGPIC